MATATREGVIKFQLDFRQGPPPEAPDLVELDAWRDVLLRHGLIGQDPGRYDGLGFGNLSRRVPGRTDNAFIISGTQTGHLKKTGGERLRHRPAVRPVKQQIDGNRTDQTILGSPLPWYFVSELCGHPVGDALAQP